MKAFQNQVAVITGGGQGVGLEISKQLARQGAHVVLNDIDESLLNDAARVIHKESNNCFPLAGDASDPSFIRELIQLAVDRFGHVDMAIANAGISIYQDFLDYKPEDFNLMMKVNLGSSFFLAQAAARQMKEQRSGGRILFMSSVIGHQAQKNLAAYGMSKAAVEMLAKTLVAEISSYKITVNALAPGATVKERTVGDKEYAKTWSKLTPIGKPATVQDIAEAAIFLLSPQASHITGQTLVIDGGWSSVSPSPSR